LPYQLPSYNLIQKQVFGLAGFFLYALRYPIFSFYTASSGIEPEARQLASSTEIRLENYRFYHQVFDGNL